METIFLIGCTPEPLMNYLKALGVLRLVAEQADPDARATWRNGLYVLQTKLGAEELENFFLNKYAPSPIIAPWGARSGFYEGSSEKTAREALNKISNATDERFGKFKQIIKEVRELLRELHFSGKPKDEEKLQLLAHCRTSLNDSTLMWLDACYVLTGDERRFPPLFGTGGNEGSCSYVSGFAQQVASCLIERQHDMALKIALFEGAAAGIATSQTPGHFSPNFAGGPNATQGLKGKPTTNPWDYLLAIEGACLWASGVFRKCGVTGKGMAAFPFTVQVSSAGASSLGINDNKKPKKAKREVAEMWLPVWHRLLGLRELSSLLAEGRATIGRRTTQTGLDFARAAAGLGVDRGIKEFVRIGFLMRNGKSFLGVSLGNLPVAKRQEIHLLNEIDSWLESFKRACGDNTPARFTSALRTVERAIFDFCHYGKPFFQTVLIALGRAEAVIASSPGFHEKTKVKLSPLANLSQEWIKAAHDDSREFEIALALASIHEARGRLGPLRVNLEPVVCEKKGWAWAEKGRAVVWNASDLATNLAAILGRRVMDGQRVGSYQEDSSRNEFGPLASFHHVSLSTVTAFLAGEVNDQRISDLLWGLMLCKVHEFPRVTKPDGGRLPSRAYALLKLLFLSGPLWREKGKDEKVWIDPDFSTLPLLRSGRAPEACELARRRLCAKGLMPMPQPMAGRPRRSEVWHDLKLTPFESCRLPAALLLPISPDSASEIQELVIRPPKPKKQP